MAAVPPISTVYVPFHFATSEGWRLTSDGNPGESRLEGSRLVLDFTHGAKWIGIAPPDLVVPGRMILGNASQFTIHIQGLNAVHPVQLRLLTHFMTYYTTIAPAPGSENEIIFTAPPGPGWQWIGGENKGGFLEPLRIAEIRFDANGKPDRVQLDLMDISVEGTQPADKLCVMTARASGGGFLNNLRCLGNTPLSGELSWTFRDWDGNDLGHGSEPITVPAHGEPLQTPITSVAPPDRKFIEAEFQVGIPGQKIAPVSPCWTAMPPPQANSSLDPGSPFGMGVYLYRDSGPDMERVAALARDAGVKWSREWFDWDHIEPQRGHFDWSYYDDLVATARRNGISIYGLVFGWASWTTPYTESGIADYTAFLQALVRHYRPDIHDWEIWNEPNIFFWQGPKEMYAELLRKSYAAAKEADPNAQVLGMSTAGLNFDFIAHTMALDAPFDILTIHPYRKVLDDRELMNEMMLASRLAAGRPVWVTEFGWSTYTPHNTIHQDFLPTTERKQAQLLARAYLSLLASGVRTNISWYDFRDDGDDPLNRETRMGILHRDFTPKPAYAAYSTLTRLLKEQKLSGPVETGNKDVLAYRFTGKTGSVIALWSPTSDQTVTLPAAGKRVTLVNTIGESHTLPAGSMQIHLRQGAPVYLRTE